MNGHRILSKVVLVLLVGGAVAGAVWTRLSQPVSRMQPVIPPPVITAVPDGQGEGSLEQPGISDFTATLHSGKRRNSSWGHVQNRAATWWMSPRWKAQTDGAYIEKQILPEFDGEDLGGCAHPDHPGTGISR